MKQNKSNHKYLLSLYSRVDDFLSNGGNENLVREDLPDPIVSFCVVVEKIMKMKLYRKNPLLVFDTSCIRDDDALSVITLKKEDNIETAKIKNIIGRFEVVFKRVFTPDELQALRDIYEIRNKFVHGYKSDDKIIFDAEDMVKKMGTIWEKISIIAIFLFGKETIKSGRPRKKYTEKELEQVLEDEVRKMIQPPSNNAFAFATLSSLASIASPSTLSILANKKKCPRCGSYSLSLDNRPISAYNLTDQGFVLDAGSNLYKCDNCHLELTEKQYEITKKIIGTI
ncbi:MAG: hypothetical protein Q8N90_04115 [bacterium]|nr:hypothetical protein [bacterium]